MKELRTEITLEAPVDRIWDLLADCSLYPQWNPLFQLATGRMNAGERLELLVSLPEMNPFTITPTLMTVEQQTSFCWQQKMLCASLFTWRYSIELEILTQQRLKFIQRSAFGGILAPLFNLAMNAVIAKGLEKMNAAIRRWGEKGNIQCLRC